MTAAIHDQFLDIAGNSVQAVGLAAAAFLRAPRPVAMTPKRPYWAYGSAAILAASFVLSWLRLSAASIIVLGAVALGVMSVVFLLAHREGTARQTALGLVPVLILIAFSVVYAIAGLTGESLSLETGGALHLRDALLLSVSLATTVGVLDLTLVGWLRSMAYLEMLLVAGSLGTAALVAARSLSVRLDRAIRELRLERERG